MTKHALSPYELLRLERMKRNEERLAQLGLLKKTPLPVRKKVSKKPRIVTPPSTMKRRSNRLKDQTTTTITPTPTKFDEEKVETNQIGYFDEEMIAAKPRRKRRKLLAVSQEDLLSETDRESLAGAVDENFLDKFQEFLEFQDKISPQNVRNVMRQARKLASGEGIRYESPTYGWDKGCYFQKGVKITPLSDFVQLMVEGQEAEDKWGRDHGNGWLLSHPLKKLLLFQQFILRNPGFLRSKLRLKDYCE